ncbi:MAG: GNAT family N-acetyltransferase [Anaerolineae bacterium]|nr:GNAT family N-acetyltransferase [Anaerolineae bacterium]
MLVNQESYNLELSEVQPDDYPMIARLLADAFAGGKYATAFGKDAGQRAALFEIMLRCRALSKGLLYTVRETPANGDAPVAATVVMKYENVTIAPANRRAARAEIAQRAGWVRAWWATTVLRLASSPRLEPHQGYMDDLVVNPAFRRQGIAQRILYAAFDYSRAMGKTEMLADVVPTNKPVMGLIKVTGWEIVSRNYLAAPLTLPLFGFASVYRIRRDLALPNVTA